MDLLEIKSLQIVGSDILGSSAKIYAHLNTTPASITFTLESPCTDKKITDAAMVCESPKIYSYIVTTSNTWVEGDYCFRVTVSDGNGTWISEEFFNFKRPFDMRLIE